MYHCCFWFHRTTSFSYECFIFFILYKQYLPGWTVNDEFPPTCADIALAECHRYEYGLNITIHSIIVSRLTHIEQHFANAHNFYTRFSSRRHGWCFSWISAVSGQMTSHCLKQRRPILLTHVHRNYRFVMMPTGGTADCSATAYTSLDFSLSIMELGTFWNKNQVYNICHLIYILVSGYGIPL